MPETTVIRIQKEALKFASAHMTVFENGSKEALHGHQYLPTVCVQVQNEMIPFSKIKTAMKSISDAWDEKVLLAANNPRFKILKKDKSSIHFMLCKKEYLLPAEEVVLLPVVNVTCEELAKHYSEKLLKALPVLKKVKSYSVEIQESPGQSAIFTRRLSE